MRPLLTLLALLGMFSTTLASTIQVPGDYSTIQAAIGAAVNGDTVLVAPGNYVENINFDGKAITVMSSGGPEVTTIDGGAAGSVVTFDSGEGPSAVLEGFTIQNGTGTEITPGVDYYCGGGILCYSGSSPTIRGNHITDNYIDHGSTLYGYGGGICCLEDSSPTISGNTIRNNFVAGRGAGISLRYRCHPLIEDNVIEDNTAQSNAGGIQVLYSSAPTINRNQIRRNESAAAHGGGMVLNTSNTSDIIIANNVIANNTAFQNSGGVHCFAAKVVFSNNLFIENTAGINTGGLRAVQNSTITVSNCTFSRNSAGAGGGIGLSLAAPGTMVMKNSIVWNNSAPEIEIDPGTATPSITYCDIAGGWAGTGNINSDPQFVDPDQSNFLLQQSPCQPGVTNPCVDSGDPGSPLLGGHTRSDGISDSGTVDMGYHPLAWLPDPDDDIFNGDQEDRSGTSSDPVNTATGSFLREEVDFVITTRAKDLVFGRSYTSRDTSWSALGWGWTHSFDISLDDSEPDSQVSVHWGDGRKDYWILDGAEYRPSVPNLLDSLTDNGNSTWTVTKKDLTSYEFDSGGRLTSIVDRNGNSTTLAYHPNGDLETVTDPAGRAVTFVHDVNGYLTSITDFAVPARQVLFSYTGGYLTQVTDVMGETILYSYDLNGFLKEIIDQRGLPPIVTNTYDVNGRVTQQQDALGSYTDFFYDTPAANQTTISQQVTVEGVPRTLNTIHTHSEVFKLLESIQNPLGDVVVFAHDVLGNTTSITDRNGNVSYMEYDQRSNLLKITDPDDPGDGSDGGVTTIEYGASASPDLPVKRTDALGIVTDWTYDLLGNLETETHWLDVAQTESEVRSWTYNGFGQVATETDENGHTKSWTYDSNGLLTEMTDAESRSTWYGHDGLWRVTEETDGRGTGAGDANFTTTYTYDNADRLLTVTSPPVGLPIHAITRSTEWDEVGNLVGVTDGKGQKVVLSYDGNSNLTRVEEPLNGNPQGRVNESTYDELNRRITETDPNTNVTTYLWDDANRLERRRDAAGNEWTFTYDDHGNILTETTPPGVTTTFEYDALNRVISREDELGHEWSFGYDQLGRMISQIDPNTHQTQFTFDALGHLTRVDDAASGITLYEWDALGNLTQITDAAGKITSTRTYWDDNRLKTASDGLGHTYSYAYDGAGNQTSVLDGKGDLTVLEYDAVNRQTRIGYPDATQVTFAYDDNSNLTSMVDPVGTSSFTYDERDRLRSSTDPYSKQVQYDYDEVGNRTKLIYPDSKEVNYVFDSANRLSTITDFGTRVTTYVWSGIQVSSVTFPNGVVETRGYDDAGRLASLETEDSLSTTLLSLGWTRDGTGNPTSLVETGTLSPTLLPMGVVHYRYDADNRLNFARAPWNPTPGQPTHVKPILNDGRMAFEYDGNGNLISQLKGSVRTFFGYDGEDRLVSQSTGPSLVEHLYDGLGERIARIYNGSATRYVLDRSTDLAGVVCETDAAGTITAYYVPGLELVARIGSDGSERYYHSNDVGHILALTDQTETITDRYAYSPFGVLAGREGTTDNPFTYVGSLGVTQEADGLYFMRARFFDPVVGRFLGKDPVEGLLDDPQELHRYVYVTNDPTLFVDPDGEFLVLDSKSGNGLSISLDFYNKDGKDAPVRQHGGLDAKALESLSDPEPPSEAGKDNKKRGRKAKKRKQKRIRERRKAREARIAKRNARARTKQRPGTFHSDAKKQTYLYKDRYGGGVVIPPKSGFGGGDSRYRYSRVERQASGLPVIGVSSASRRGAVK